MCVCEREREREKESIFGLPEHVFALVTLTSAITLNVLIKL